MDGNAHQTTGILKSVAVVAWPSSTNPFWFVMVVTAAAVVNLLGAVYTFSIRRQSLLAMIAGVGFSLVTIYFVLRLVRRNANAHAE